MAPSPLVIEALREAGRLAAADGVRLAIENGVAHVAGSARSMANVLDVVGMENVGANWDPGNAWPWDPDLDAAPTILGDRIFNIHVKDTTIREGKRVHDSVGNGSIDWKGQMDLLKGIGYAGPVVIETHCTPSVEKSRENLDILTKWIG